MASEKANAVTDLPTQMTKEHEEMRAIIRQAVFEGLELYEDREALVNFVEYYVMNAGVFNSAVYRK